MTTSGTIQATTFDTGKVIDTAFRRCKIAPELVTPEMIQTAQDALYVLLMELPVMGLQLWAIDKQILPCVTGQAAVSTSAGTIDLQNTTFRTLTEVANTGSAVSATTYRMTPTASATVSTIGIKFASGGTFALNLQTWDGATATTVKTVASATYAAGVWAWFDIDPPPTATAFQVVEATGATIFVSAGFLGNNPYEIPMSRISQDDYTALPNKTFLGRPTIFWLDRRYDVPVINLWPAPSSSYATAQIVIYRQRYIQDVGTMQQTLEVPQRWLNAIIAQLALRLSMEIPMVDAAVVPGLTALAQQTLQAVQNDERDASPMTMAPNIAYYTV